MNQLIFYSIPGLVFALPFFWFFPEIIMHILKQSPEVIALTPLLGYIVHQTYRLFFECTGNFARKSRKVVQYIRCTLAKQNSMSITGLDAFLVWEIAIYDNKDFSGFREHDAKSWHFILAFWSTAFASICGTLISSVFYLIFQGKNIICKPEIIIGVCIQIFLPIIFWIRGKNVYKTINEQEVAFVKQNQHKFKEYMKNISANISDPTQHKN